MKKIYGLIGYPLSHSFSRNYFTDKFSREGIEEDYDYVNYELQHLEDFPSLLESNSSLFGLNVTIPHKQNIIPFLDELKGHASAAGAVNTILISRDPNGKVTGTCGYNTDVTGFYETLKPLLQPHHTGALVLGSGGASKAVVHALGLLALPFQVVSRQHQEATIAYADITAPLLRKYPVIINTTPLGTFPETGFCPDIPYHLLGKSNLLYDLVYNPPESEFLLKGKNQGAQTVNGYEMLVAQAEAAWKIWMSSR